MTFKYFDKPNIFVGFRDEETICDTCGQHTSCFDAQVFYGRDELTSICAECLGSGKLIEMNASTCTGDIKKLVEQLKLLNPTLPEDEINELARKKTIELEKTTPHLITWQEWYWPCSDGDYCKFIGYGSKPFYKELANGRSVETFFKDSFYEADSYHVDLWTDALADDLIKDYNDSDQYETLFYVFKSLNSDRIITMWDCN